MPGCACYFFVLQCSQISCWFGSIQAVGILWFSVLFYPSLNKRSGTSKEKTFAVWIAINLLWVRHFLKCKGAAHRTDQTMVVGDYRLTELDHSQSLEYSQVSTALPGTPNICSGVKVKSSRNGDILTEDHSQWEFGL